MKKEKFQKVFKEIFTSIRNRDHETQARLMKEYPWSKRWLGRTSENAHLETVADGDGPEWVEKEGTCPFREERGFRPLLSIIVKTSTGSTYFNLEPEGEEEFMVRD